MAVRVRLTRVGSKKNPIWRVVVADGRSPRDGKFIETVGHYNPQTQPSTIVLDQERLQHWIDRGAQPSGTVKKLMRSGGAPPAAQPDESAEESTDTSAENDQPTDDSASAEPESAEGQDAEAADAPSAEQAAGPATEQSEPASETS